MYDLNSKMALFKCDSVWSIQVTSEKQFGRSSKASGQSKQKVFKTRRLFLPRDRTFPGSISQEFSSHRGTLLQYNALQSAQVRKGAGGGCCKSRHVKTCGGGGEQHMRGARKHCSAIAKLRRKASGPHNSRYRWVSQARWARLCFVVVSRAAAEQTIRTKMKQNPDQGDASRTRVHSARGELRCKVIWWHREACQLSITQRASEQFKRRAQDVADANVQAASDSAVAAERELWSQIQTWPPLWSCFFALRHFGRLSHGSIKTRRNSIHY